ncbi:MAG TPA: DUF3135 domain-containing protein [Paucimonas sp.]|nr:DUF3135 domain-containing protein [Paucimonas sp.]
MHPDIRLPDFDTLAALHRQDPDTFEEFRKQLLQKTIDYAPPAHRPALERLLQQIEAARDTTGTPMEALLISFRMMQGSLQELQDAWKQAQYALQGLQAALVIERARQ